MTQSSDFSAGDLVGFYTSGVFAWFIRLGQWFARVKYRDITHIAIVERTTSNGDASIIQSVRRVNRVWLSSYDKTPYVILPFPGREENRADVVDFARSYIGRKYGVLSVLSRAWNIVTPKWVQFGINRAGDLDCSALGARAFEHGGVILPWRDPWQVMPGQLADAYLKETP